MRDRMMWLTTPIVLVSGACYQAPPSGNALPRATAETYAVACQAAPLTLEETACLLAGLHPCHREADDDPSLMEHERRVLAKLEADAGRGLISSVLTLHEAVAWAKRVGLPIPAELAALNRDDAKAPSGKCVRDTRAAPTRGSKGLEEAFASMAKQKAEALIWLGGAPISAEQQVDKLVDLAAKARLPALYGDRWSVEAGGLLSYGPNYLRTWKTAAIYVDKILKGRKPANLPVQQPTEFELVINLKTAKALGLTIPQSLLLRADVIE